MRPSIATRAKRIGQFPGVILIALSLWNAQAVLRNVYHRPISASDVWAELRAELAKTRSEFRRLGVDSSGFRVEERPPDYSLLEYFTLQNLLAPTALIRESDGPHGPYLLVQFYMTRKVKPLPDLVLVEDLGNGFGLYRTKQ